MVSGSPGTRLPIVVWVKVGIVATITPARMPAKAPAAVTGLRGIRLATTVGNSCVTKL